MMEWKLMIFIAADTQKAAKMFLLATSWPHQSATSCWVWFSFFGKFTSQLYLPDIPLSVLCQKFFISLSLYMGQKLLKAALVRHQKLRKSYVIIHNFLPRRRVKVQRKRRGALDNANLYSMIKVKRLHFPTELPSMQLFSSTTATNIFSPSLASASHSTLTNVFRHHRCEFLLYSTRLNSTKKFFFFLLSYFEWRKNTQTRIHHSNTERRTEQKLVIPFRNLMWKICFNFMTVSLSAYTTVGWPERNCWSKVRNFPKKSRCHVASIRWSAQPGSLNTFSLYFRSFPSSQAFIANLPSRQDEWVIQRLIVTSDGNRYGLSIVWRLEGSDEEIELCKLSKAFSPSGVRHCDAPSSPPHRQTENEPHDSTPRKGKKQHKTVCDAVCSCSICTMMLCCKNWRRKLAQKIDKQVSLSLSNTKKRQQQRVENFYNDEIAPRGYSKWCFLCDAIIACEWELSCTQHAFHLKYPLLSKELCKTFLGFPLIKIFHLSDV